MRILAMFSAAFAAAAALCAYALPAAWGWLPGLCLAALAAVLLFLHGDPVRRVRTIALGLAAGFLWCWADAGRLVSVRALCGEGADHRGRGLQLAGKDTIRLPLRYPAAGEPYAALPPQCAGGCRARRPRARHGGCDGDREFPVSGFQ